MEIRTSSSCFGLWASAMVSAIACSLFFAIFASLLAVVGTTLGVISGALIGVKSKSGFVHGATVGTIMGFILSVEICKVSFAVWDSDDPTIRCFIALLEKASKHLKEKLLQGRFSPTIQFLQESQADAVHKNEVQRTKETSKIRLTYGNIIDNPWNGPSCSICLQDFDLGETVCSLPHCGHTFHLLCIKKWFVRHSSCPMCRSRLPRTWIATVCKVRKEMSNVS